MILAANQPYFLPYLGYFQLINTADIFLFADDYAFIKGGWITKNRILTKARVETFAIEVKGRSSFKNINELYLGNRDYEHKLRVLKHAYGKAPMYSEGIRLIEEIFNYEEDNLALFLENQIKVICNYLDIDTRFGRTSDFEGNSDFKREERAYDLCKRTGADTYINPIGGTSLYSIEEFEKRGITLRFLKKDDITYKQFGNEFIDNLSILDLIMFLPKEEIKELLNRYELVTE